MESLQAHGMMTRKLRPCPYTKAAEKDHKTSAKEKNRPEIPPPRQKAPQEKSGSSFSGGFRSSGGSSSKKPQQKS